MLLKRLTFIMTDTINENVKDNNLRKAANSDTVDSISTLETLKSNREQLKDVCTKNADYFAKDSSENGQRLYLSFLSMTDNIQLMWPTIMKLQNIAPNFDYNKDTPANGFRSFISIVNFAMLHGIQLGLKVCLKRESILFRKTTITREVECCAQLLASLVTCLNQLDNLLLVIPDNELFPTEEGTPNDLIQKSLTLNKHCFYGRSLGFQYCESIKSTLSFIMVAMAIFSEAYYSQGSFLSKATNSLMSSTKYITDPEERAKRTVNIFMNADVYFCKAFWFLAESELMQHVPTIVSQNVAVSKIISLPSEPLTLTVDGKTINVPVPLSHIGNKPIQVRLISDEIREGMIGSENKKCSIGPPSRGLVIHCHGGGFVAQSSKAHETYLRDWAKELKVPILSIDYSLAPEAPFPRAQEEVTYAYCWALKNHNLLGSTGECIVGAGDSAGANLILTMTLKCLDMGVPLLKGIFVAYVPTLVTCDPSPSRLLSILDPLLPFGFLMRCLKAYTIPESSNIKQEYTENEDNIKSDTESFEEISESDLVELQAHKSPISETSDTLTLGSLTSQGEEPKNVDTIKENPCYVIGSDIEQNGEFLDKYVIESESETDGTKISVLKHESSSSNSNFDVSLTNKIVSFVSSLKKKVDKLILRKAHRGAANVLDIDNETNVMEEFNFKVPRNPYLSPYFASNEDLMRMPPTKILTVHFDPCLDDCIIFAKKLKNLGNNVHLDILPGLPHGFLNFSMISKEAHDGSKLCAKRISELLNIPPTDSSKCV